jgi:hypothetical protein
VSGLSGKARSQDGHVEVTVASSGALVDLRLADDIRRYPASRIAEQVLATVRAAELDLVSQVRTAAAETVGLDSETGRAVVATFASRLPSVRSEADWLRLDELGGDDAAG